MKSFADHIADLVVLKSNIQTERDAAVDDEPRAKGLAVAEDLVDRLLDTLRPIEKAAFGNTP